jgi:hypothetical protein
LNLSLDFTLNNEELGEIINNLRKNDDNRAKVTQIELDYQGYTGVNDNRDNAHRP